MQRSLAVDTPDSTTKRCVKCGIEYPATMEYFHLNNQQKDGLNVRCKGCKNADSRDLYSRIKDTRLKQIADYQRRTPDKQRAKSRRHYWRNHEKELERARRVNAVCRPKRIVWYQKNKGKIALRNKQWREANLETCRMKARQYYQEHKAEALLRWRNREAKKRWNGGSHTQSDLDLMYRTQQGRCWYCQCELNGKYEVEHRVPIDRGGHNNPSNLVLACRDCNRSKGNKLPSEWNGRLL
jgi:5-methylcytosine-specific restriction endonuclease McrA